MYRGGYEWIILAVQLVTRFTVRNNSLSPKGISGCNPHGPQGIRGKGFNPFGVLPGELQQFKVNPPYPPPSGLGGEKRGEPRIGNSALVIFTENGLAMEKGD